MILLTKNWVNIKIKNTKRIGDYQKVADDNLKHNFINFILRKLKIWIILVSKGKLRVLNFMIKRKMSINDFKDKFRLHFGVLSNFSDEMIWLRSLVFYISLNFFITWTWRLMFSSSIYSFSLVNFEMVLSFFSSSFCSCRILACSSLERMETIEVDLPF